MVGRAAFFRRHKRDFLQEPFPVINANRAAFRAKVNFSKQEFWARDFHRKACVFGNDKSGAFFRNKANRHFLRTVKGNGELGAFKSSAVKKTKIFVGPFMQGRSVMAPSHVAFAHVASRPLHRDRNPALSAALRRQRQVVAAFNYMAGLYSVAAWKYAQKLVGVLKFHRRPNLLRNAARKVLPRPASLLGRQVALLWIDKVFYRVEFF